MRLRARRGGFRAEKKWIKMVSRLTVSNFNNEIDCDRNKKNKDVEEADGH